MASRKREHGEDDMTEFEFDLPPDYDALQDSDESFVEQHMFEWESASTSAPQLWEFIRDALCDPLTCPSIVRWEDAEEGVFRIIESEKLAKLWGGKKNNSKMTYEKLSRAMRTYYDKGILSPVPKTGLYPKKLVYKFGPLSHGWRVDGTPHPPKKDKSRNMRKKRTKR